MANIFDNKKPQVAGDPAALETPNYISQINAGGTLYDIATHHGITFKNGMTDKLGTVWNGITDLEVIIPTVTDLVKTPIQFAGTVGAGGTISYRTGVSETPEAGYLVFITADCTFETVACEAGDMAVYDGSKWNVVTGENQVEILNVGENNEANVVLTATAKDVLTVEGKTLKLSVDYTGVEDVLTISKNGDVIKLTAADGKTDVDAKYLKLTKGADVTKTIGKKESAEIPTALKSGNVNIKEKVLVKDDINLTSGAFPTLKKNDTVVVVDVNNALSVGTDSTADGATGAYVASIDGAIKSATLVASDTAADAALTFVKSISTKEGAKFVNGIHVAASTEETDGKGDIVIPGKASLVADKKTFVTGLSEAGDAGALVSTIEVGDVTVGAGTDIVTGLDKVKQDASGEVITNVTVGSAVQDTTAQWFYSGLGEATTSEKFDVVSSVSVGDVSLVADDANAFAKDVLATATVDNHVLSFGTVKVSSPVKVDQKTSTINGKSFIKSGVKLSGFTVASANLAKGGISQAKSVIKYKDIATGDVELTYAGDVKYYFDKANSSAFEAKTGYAKLDTVNAIINKNTPVLKGSVTASIPVNKVVVDFATAGTLPSLSVGEASGTLTASVGTELAATTKEWIGLENADIDVAGAYTLNESTETSEGAIEVARAGIYDLKDAHCDIAAKTFVTDVTVKKKNA